MTTTTQEPHRTGTNVSDQPTTLPHAQPAPGVRFQLSVMMFLQYAIWGAWLPLFFPFLTGHRGLQPADVGLLFAIGAIGALLAPFVAGQIADRWFNSERFLAVSHLLGAALVWQLANVGTWGGLLVFSLLYSLIYAPTLSLTNAIAFHHLPDRDRDFGKVRVWGTVGWIVVGIGIGQWLLYRHTPADGAPDAVQRAQLAGMADAFRLSAVLGVILGLYCFFLPRTPPQRGRAQFAPAEALGEVVRKRALLWLFVIAFPISVVHQFYFVHTAGFLGDLQRTGGATLANTINRIFGVGGGGLMTIGQISEIVVLALIPLFAKTVSRKTFLTIGILAYVLRFFIFAYLPQPWAVIPALALHGLCFGCFLFVAFMIVDENTTQDVRASAQGLFNLVIVGLGVIGGNYFAGLVAARAKTDAGIDYRMMFSVPMWVSLACLVLLVVTYPRYRPAEATSAG